MFEQSRELELNLPPTSEVGCVKYKTFYVPCINCLVFDIRIVDDMNWGDGFSKVKSAYFPW